MSARKHKGRPAREPRSGAWLNTIHRQQAINEGQQRDLSLPVRMAMLAIQRGVGDEYHASTLAQAVNVALVLSERYRDRDPDRIHETVLIAAADALARVMYRGRETGRFLFDGDALRALSGFGDIYEAQLAAFTRDSFLAAGAEVLRRVRRGEVIECVKVGA